MEWPTTLLKRIIGAQLSNLVPIQFQLRIVFRSSWRFPNTYMGHFNLSILFLWNHDEHFSTNWKSEQKYTGKSSQAQPL